MRASNRFVRLVAGSAALGVVLASPLAAVAAPRSFQTPTPMPGETVTATPSETVTATPSDTVTPSPTQAPTDVPTTVATTPTATETATVVPSETVTTTPSVLPTVDLGVSAEVAPQPVTVGDPFKYTVTMTHTNDVTSPETEVELVITYPAFVKYVEEGTNLDNLQFTLDQAKREIRVTYPVQGEEGSVEITFVLVATGLSQAKGNPLNDIVATFPDDVITPDNNESRVEVTAVNAMPSPSASATPSATATPTATPTAPPTPTAPSLPTARPTVPPTPAPTTPPTRAASQLDVSVRVVAATNPAIVGGNVVIETTTTNVGAETAGPVVLADEMPAFLQLMEVRSDDLSGYYDVENGTVVVTHPRLAPGRSITTYLVARAVTVSGPQGAATNNNVVSVYADEYGYERTIADDEEITEIIVATASSTTTTKTTTTTTGGSTTTGSKTTASAAPTASASPPASLPDTGVGTTNTLVLALAASTFLGAGVVAQAMLRRRTR